MSVPVWSRAQWRAYTQNASISLTDDPSIQEKQILLLTTPFCGTCQLTVRMMEVIREGKPEWPIGILSTTDFSSEFQDWRIESVPCILILRGCAEVDRWYRMGSVTELWQRLAIHFKE